MGASNKKIELLKNLEKKISEPFLLVIGRESKENCIKKCDEIIRDLRNDKDVVINLFGYSSWHNYLQIAIEEKKLFSRLEEDSVKWKCLNWYHGMFFLKCPILREEIDLSSSEGLFVKSLVLGVLEKQFSKEMARNILKVNPERMSRRIVAFYELYYICRENRDHWKTYLNLPPLEGRTFILAYMRKCGDIYSCPYRRVRYENDTDVMSYLKTCQKIGLKKGE